MTEKLIEAVRARAAELVGDLIAAGADPDTREAATGLTVLMIAAGQGDAPTVRTLIEFGADVFTTDSEAGCTALHKACQGGSLEAVGALVEAGAFIDAVAPTTGHTPLREALGFRYPVVAKYLLDLGAGLNLATRYGSTLIQSFEDEIATHTRGREPFAEAEAYLSTRMSRDRRRVREQHLVAAARVGDLATVRGLLAAGVPADERFPVVAGRDDGHTALLVAAREGHADIAAELLRRGADGNAIEPVFGTTALHQAVTHGRLAMTRLLAAHPGVDLDLQASTTGYTPLHDAVRHGREDCVRALLIAGARLDVPGHDGKRPIDLATDLFGPEHALTGEIARRSKD